VQVTGYLAAKECFGTSTDAGFANGFTFGTGSEGVRGDAGFALDAGAGSTTTAVEVYLNL